ncbi:titin-like [Leptodactylus fuscus]|uniref:titin-like n=1 Tax=Leptodactylus fuscus TaxID=238119 RepID=UPI003F4EBDC8
MLGTDVSSSFVISAEEETTETYKSNLHLKPNARTLESMPETSLYSSKLEIKKEVSFPIFIQQLSSVEAKIGDVVKLSVIVSGFPKPKIQWLHNGNMLSSSETYTFVYDDNEYSCIIPYVNKANEGEYTCIATNEQGETICSSYLTVQTIEVRKQIDAKLEVTDPSTNKSLTKKSYKKSSIQETTETRLYAVNLSGDAWAGLQERDTMLYTIGTEGKYSAEREEVDTVQELLAVEQQAIYLKSNEKELIPLTASLVSENIIEQQDKEIAGPVIEELTESQIQPLQVSVTEEITSTHKESELKDSYLRIENANVKSEEKTKYGAVMEEAKHIMSYEEQLLRQESPQLREIDMSHLPTRAETVSLDPLEISTIESQHTMLKEKELDYEQGEGAKAVFLKEPFLASSSVSEERKQIQCEHTSPISGSEDGLIAEFVIEQEQPINIQVVDSQDQLRSEEPFSFDIPPEDQAELAKSPVYLLSSLSDERLPILCLDTGHVESIGEEVTLSFSKEQLPLLHLQTINSEFMLPKEEQLTLTDPESHIASNKMEKSYNCSLLIEDKRLLSAESVKTLQTDTESVNPTNVLEHEHLRLANVVEDFVLLPKEDLVIAQKEQRGSLQKEDYQPVIQLCTTDERRTIDEGHASSVPDTEISTCDILNELTFPLESHCVENHGITTESVKLLDEAQQDYASRIQEGQSIRLPLVLEEKHSIQEEHLKTVEKSDAENLSVEFQVGQTMGASEVFDLETFSKEDIISEEPKSFSLEIKGHVKSALYAALHTKPHIFSAQFLNHLEDIHIRNIQRIKESNHILCSCLITSSNFATEEIILSLPNVYPQKADLKSELSAALRAVICEEKKSLECENRENLGNLVTKNLEISQLAVSTEAGEFEHISPKDTSAMVLVNTEIKDVGAAYYTDEVMSVTVTFEGQMDIVKKLEKPGEIYEEDTPLIRQTLIDVAADEGSSVTLKTVIANAKSVNWYFMGKLLSSGIEFICSENDDIYTLVISNVHMDLHQGEYTCEALNDAGKSTTSATLTVVKRGWIMGIIE